MPSRRYTIDGMDCMGDERFQMEPVQVVFCILCAQLRTVTHAHAVFRTGFKTIGSVIYPLATCHSSCEFHKPDDDPDSLESDPSIGNGE